MNLDCFVFETILKGFFDDYDYKIAKREIERSGSPDETEAFFNGPNPEEKKEYELNMMSHEDPLNKEPFAREELNIFRVTTYTAYRRLDRRETTACDKRDGDPGCETESELDLRVARYIKLCAGPSFEQTACLHD